MTPTQMPLDSGCVLLGDRDDAIDAARNRPLGVRYVLCLQQRGEDVWSPERVARFHNYGGILVHLPLFDDDRMRFSDLMHAASILLYLTRTAATEDRKVLVHCTVGASRTAAVYLTARLLAEFGDYGSTGWPLEMVDPILNELRAARPVTCQMYSHHYDLLTGGPVVPYGGRLASTAVEEPAVAQGRGP